MLLQRKKDHVDSMKIKVSPGQTSDESCTLNLVDVQFSYYKQFMLHYKIRYTLIELQQFYTILRV